jgi:hypothetical protein
LKKVGSPCFSFFFSFTMPVPACSRSWGIKLQL